MVFQWCQHCWTIAIECFWRTPPLISMVFQKFLKLWGQWSTMFAWFVIAMRGSEYQVRLAVASSTLLQKRIVKIENGNSNHKKVPCFLETTVNVIDCQVQWFLGTIEHFNGWPLEIFNRFWGDHHHWMFLGGLTIAINGFSMVFVYQGVTRQILTVAGGTLGTALLWYI